MGDTKIEVGLDLKEKAMRVFGDVVKNAYSISTINGYCDFDDVEDIERHKEYQIELIKDIQETLYTDDLDATFYDYIVIEFITGKKIYMEVSEHGEFKPI